MGLDITAYKGLTKVGEFDRATFDYDYPDGTTVFYENTDFPGRGEGIDFEAIYEYEDAFGFRAGSYSGYNWWREELARLAGYTCEDAWSRTSWDVPFFELVCFADNEGTIGPVVAAKLAKDFAEFDEKAKTHAPDSWFYEAYEYWRDAFKMAAENGAVDFH